MKFPASSRKCTALASLLLPFILKASSSLSISQRQSRLKTQNIPQDDLSSIQSLKISIEKSIIPTNRGIFANKEKQLQIDSLLCDLESKCLLDAPARDPRMGGKWKVLYTNAPPPSNGQLGPFIGMARQFVDLKGGSYVNILEVDPQKWLRAELKAKWFEWDGSLLEYDTNKNENAIDSDDYLEQEPKVEIVVKGENNDVFTSVKSLISNFNSLGNAFGVNKMSEVDYGATCWRVDFESLSIQVFGIPIVTKKFENTSRVWRMSYVDDDTRIVRAGRSGEKDDEFVFYMTREDDKMN